LSAQVDQLSQEAARVERARAEMSRDVEERLTRLSRKHEQELATCNAKHEQVRTVLAQRSVTLAQIVGRQRPAH